MGKSVAALLCVTFALLAMAQEPAHTENLPASPSTTLTAIKHEQQVYMPLNSREKFSRWAHHTYSPYLLFSSAFGAGISQAAGDWPTYGGGMEGYGKRFGATLADTEISGFFRIYLLPSILHDDPRYFHARNSKFFGRTFYAASRVLVTRADDGADTFNIPEVAGSLFYNSVANAYYPRRERGFGETMSRTGNSLLSDAGTNVLREFWPDIRRVLLRREPKRMKELENKVPGKVKTVARPPGDGE